LPEENHPLAQHLPDLVYTTFDTPPEASAKIVDAGLDEYNFAVAPLTDVVPLAAVATNADSRVVGGAVGRTWGGCCELLQLWVEPTCRSSGVGTRLLKAFEARARTRGCNVFYLTTLSFQAPEFYRKHGYEAIAQISGYPNGIVKYLMHKTEPLA
jgi:GNAT superfamily N-acetyltransferase